MSEIRYFVDNSLKKEWIYASQNFRKKIIQKIQVIYERKSEWKYEQKTL